jgi:hypothetical protein
MEPTDTGDTVRPIDEPNAGGQRSAPEAPPAAEPANHVRSGDPETQQVFDVIRRAVQGSSSVNSRQPNWTRAQLIELWPMLADEERYRQYQIRTEVGLLDCFLYTLQEQFGRSASEAIDFVTAYVSARLIDLPWPDIARYRAVRNWLQAQARQPNAPILRRLAIDVFGAKTEPWVTTQELVKVLHRLWPQPPGCKGKDNYVVRHADLWRTIASTPTGWLMGLALQRTVASEIIDPLGIIGMTRPNGRWAWVIRLRFLKPGRLREALEPAWQARAKRLRWNGRRLTTEEKATVVACACRILRDKPISVPELCKQMRTTLQICLSVRTLWRHMPEVMERLRREREPSVSPPENSDAPI